MGFVPMIWKDITMSNNKPEWSPSAGDECANSRPRREAEGFFDRYMANRTVLDIGCGNHTVVPHATGWDIAKGDGDATELKGVAEGSYGCVFASHILEHLPDPARALHRWWQVVEPNGYLIVAVPDEDLYEQGQWPSLWNSDHRTTWTLHKSASWSPVSRNILDMVRALNGHKVISARILDNGYDYDKMGTDQVGVERQVEVIVQKTLDVAPWQSAIATKMVCVCKAKDSMKILGVYRNGRALVQCLSCGQQLTWELVNELKKLGLVREQKNG